jgi:hypothetical protein
MLKSQNILEHKVVVAMDCSFLKKSGEKTENIGYFYDANQGKIAKGLEISTLALIDLDQNTAYTLDAKLSPGTQLKKERIAKIKTDHLERTRQVKEFYDYQEMVDSFYAKQKFINGANTLGLDVITKLRSDCNLKYLVEAIEKPSKKEI